jgi:hypothetical protein
MHRYFLAISLVGASATGSMAQNWMQTFRKENLLIHESAAGRTCKSVSSCEEAVELWCSGYSRADADHDGIPCENVCHSVEQVNEIRKQIGCDG